MIDVRVAQKRRGLRLHHRGRVNEARIARHREYLAGFAGGRRDGRLLRRGFEIQHPAVAADAQAGRFLRTKCRETPRRERRDPRVDAMRSDIERAFEQPFERGRRQTLQVRERGTQLAERLQLRRVELREPL